MKKSANNRTDRHKNIHFGGILSVQRQIGGLSNALSARKKGIFSSFGAKAYYLYMLTDCRNAYVRYFCWLKDRRPDDAPRRCRRTSRPGADGGARFAGAFCARSRTAPRNRSRPWRRSRTSPAAKGADNPPKGSGYAALFLRQTSRHIQRSGANSQRPSRGSRLARIFRHTVREGYEPDQKRPFCGDTLLKSLPVPRGTRCGLRLV